MTTLDTVILLGLLAGFTRGLWTGALRQVASLAALVLSFFVAVPLMRPAGAVAAGVLGVSEGIAPVIGFVVVFGLIQLTLAVALRFSEKVIGMLGLGIVNRLAGGALGSLKAALLFSVFFLVLGAIGLPRPTTRAASLFYEPVAASFPLAWRVLAAPFEDARTLAERFQQHLALPLSEPLPEE